MGNLLSESFRRLFKGMRFYVVMIVIIALALIEVGLYSITNEFFDDFGEKIGVDFLAFANLGNMPLFIAITCGMLICRDFTNNTVRNKVIIGHSRTKIYLSNWILSAAVAMIYEAVHLAAALIPGIPILGAGELGSSAEIANFLVAVPYLLSFVSLTVFLCSVLRNISGAIIAIAAHYIMSMSGIFLFVLKNEELRDFLQKAVPSFQVDIIQQNFTSMPDMIMPVSTIVISVVLTVGGIVIFNKADLK